MSSGIIVDRSEYNIKDIKNDKNFKNVFKKVEVRATDMGEDLLFRCTEKITAGIEKFMPDTEGIEPQPDIAAKYVKDSMEIENGPVWICIIGENFSFNVKAQKEAYLYCYCGDYGILLYKC
jgi:hypothetical protein